MGIFLVNAITVSRILFLVLLYFYPSYNFFLFACIWAGLSDWLDGFLARKLDSTTRLGEQLDQYVDKIFHLGAFVFLFLDQFIHLWFILLFALREVLIVVLRQLNFSAPVSNWIGKTKTFVTYAFLIAVAVLKLVQVEQSLFFLLFVFSAEVITLILSYSSFSTSVLQHLTKRR